MTSGKRGDTRRAHRSSPRSHGLDSPKPGANISPTKGGRIYPKFTQPRILTPQEQKRLLRTVRDLGSPRDPRALFSLALGTGLRLRELQPLLVWRRPRSRPARATAVVAAQ